MTQSTLFDEKNTLMSWLVVALGISVFIVVITFAVSSFLPYGVDWHEAFRPAALALLSGRSPYDIDKFYNPPWGLLPLLPLALLPENFGRGLLFAISLLSSPRWHIG